MSTSSNNPPSPGGGTTSSHDNDAGDVLQASTTVTSLSVALLSLLPTTSAAKIELLNVGGHFPIRLGPVLLLCGICALLASFSSVDQLRRQAGMSGTTMLKSRLGLLFFALILFFLIYVGIAVSYGFTAGG